MEQQNVITAASHTPRTATLNINPIQTYVTHSLPRWIRECCFFSPCLPSCLPKKNASRTRLSCGCITGAAPASNQAANTHRERKTKKRGPNFGEHCYSSLLSAVFSIALAALLSTSKMAPGLLSAARLVPLCRQIISAAQNDTTRRRKVRPGHD